MTQDKARTATDAVPPVNDNVVAINSRKGSRRTAPKCDDPTEEQIEEAKTLVQKIKKAFSKELAAIVEIGLDLSKMKDLVGHGNFRTWLRDEFSWSERTATSYMDLARHFAGKTANFADLDLGTARALVASSTPAEIRDELFKRAEEGDTIAGEEVRKRIAESKSAAINPAAKANEAVPSDSKKAEELPAMGRSAAADAAGGVLYLLRCLESSRLDCDPDDVVRLLLESGDEHIPPNVKECGQFVSDVFGALLASRMPPGSEIESELELAS